MDPAAIEFELLNSPRRDDDTDDVLQLVDRWVRQFERVTDGPLEQPSAPHPSTKPARVDATSRSIANMRSEWTRVRRGTEATSTPSEPATPGAHTAEAAKALKSTGPFISFTDSIGGSISLSYADGRPHHRGTVAVRGRTQPVETACRDIGLPEQVTQAFEFVAAWFGFPFDSVNVRTGDDVILSWGFWPLSGNELVRCLHEWKRQAPDSFAGCCIAFGLDVLVAEDDAPAGDERPMLAVHAENRTLHGRSAEWAIASEPWRLAVLARAGRDAAAQRAQIELAIATCVSPVMFHPWDAKGEGERLTLDVLKSPRTIAALLYLARRHGARAALRLLNAVNERSRAQDDEDAWLNGLVRSLRHLNREQDATEVLRVASSPELRPA